MREMHNILHDSVTTARPCAIITLEAGERSASGPLVDHGKAFGQG
jgi:hypothetical protein